MEMGSFRIIQNYINSSIGAHEQEINIEHAFISSPLTPTCDSKMNSFKEEVLRECIVSNIRIQHQGCEGGLRTETWRKLVEFLSKDFKNEPETRKIFIQVLVHFSKISLDDVTPVCYGKLEFFDIMLERFVELALEDFSVNSTIRQMSTEEVIELRRRLLSKPILTAILKNLKVLDLPNAMHHIDINFISKIINSGRIYETISFKPFPKLRGAALLDGILICRRNIADDPGSITHHADLLTLAVHEFSHYIVCVVFNNLNFSSPWSNNNSNSARFDFGVIPRPLEFGRNTELVLFDGIQPDWVSSSIDAAKILIRRIDSNFSDVPIIAKNEFKKLGLCKRSPSSSYFGIDVRPEVKMME